METAKLLPGISWYLKLSVLPIEMILKGRRLNYLHYLLTRNQSSMLSRFFRVQWTDPDPGDWSLLARQDLEDLEIYLSLEEITRMKKQTFKILVKKHLQKFIFSKLLSQRQRYRQRQNSSSPSRVVPKTRATKREEKERQKNTDRSTRVHQRDTRRDSTREARTPPRLLRPPRWHKRNEAGRSRCKEERDM